VEVLILVVAADLPVAVGPEGILNRLVVDILLYVNPSRDESTKSIVQGGMMTLSARGSGPLHREASVGADMADVADVAQLIRGLIERIRQAVYQRQGNVGD
jgi:hypothetical protein